MIDPDDPRHGTYAGANQHWITKTPMCQPCGQAAYLYVKKCRLDNTAGTPRSIPIIGTRRRIQALSALGYSYNQIGAAIGVDRTLIMRWARASDRVTVHATTANKIAAAYDRLCMKIPDNSNNRLEHFRLMARRKGWAPPLAWDDIDDPNEHPPGYPQTPVDSSADPTTPDPVVVNRILAGEWRLPSTSLERAEVCRCWVERGGSTYELSKITGWRIERYYRRGAA